MVTRTDGFPCKTFKHGRQATLYCGVVVQHDPVRELALRPCKLQLSDSPEFADFSTEYRLRARQQLQPLDDAAIATGFLTNNRLYGPHDCGKSDATVGTEATGGMDCGTVPCNMMTYYCHGAVTKRLSSSLTNPVRGSAFSRPTVVSCSRCICGDSRRLRGLHNARAWRTWTALCACSTFL